MPDSNLVLTRSINPVQRIQGYVERAETVTLATHPLETVTVQKSYPGATVSVYERRPDGIRQTDEHAKIFNRNGEPINNPIGLLPGVAYYSFYAQPGRYDIKFSDAGIDPEFWLEDVAVETLVFNVRDYGARGDGDASPERDDAVAIRAAIETMKTANGGNLANGLGTLYFPNGIYIIRTPIDLPSGITLQGTNSQYSGSAGSNCMLVLATPNSSIFTIKTNRQRIIIRDLGLTTLGVDILPGTRAIDAQEDAPGLSVSGVEFENLTIWSFDRGINVESIEDDPVEWDFNNTRVNHCTIIECNYCIYLSSQNCDFWRIVDCRLGPALRGYGIYLRKVGIITIDSVLGAGAKTHIPTFRTSHSFIYLTPAHGTVTIINCECEAFLASINVAPNPDANIGWPIVVINSTLGDNVALTHNCDYISVGNRYLPDSVVCAENGTDVMIYSFGDIMAPNETDLPQPHYDFMLHGNSRVVTRANRFRVDFQRPARFGGQPGPTAPVLPDAPLAVSPFALGQAQITLCSPTGAPL